MKKFFHTNFFIIVSVSNCFLLLNEACHKLFEENVQNVEVIKARNPKLYDKLVENKFIIDDTIDECGNILVGKEKWLIAIDLMSL